MRTLVLSLLLGWFSPCLSAQVFTPLFPGEVSLSRGLQESLILTGGYGEAIRTVDRACPIIDSLSTGARNVLAVRDLRFLLLTNYGVACFIASSSIQTCTVVLGVTSSDYDRLSEWLADASVAMRLRNELNGNVNPIPISDAQRYADRCPRPTPSED